MFTVFVDLLCLFADTCPVHPWIFESNGALETVWNAGATEYLAICGTPLEERLGRVLSSLITKVAYVDGILYTTITGINPLSWNFVFGLGEPVGKLVGMIFKYAAISVGITVAVSLPLIISLNMGTSPHHALQIHVLPGHQDGGGGG